MIVGVGTDICSIGRVSAALEEFGERFLMRVLTDFERAAEPWDENKLARRWAMKEAVAKAFGTGIGGEIGFQQIEITHTETGAPMVRVAGRSEKIHASVSDDGGMAVAFVVVETA